MPNHAENTYPLRTLPCPVEGLKEEAEAMARRADMDQAHALDAVARKQGFDRWQHLLEFDRLWQEVRANAALERVGPEVSKEDMHARISALQQGLTSRTAPAAPPADPVVAAAIAALAMVAIPALVEVAQGLSANPHQAVQEAAEALAAARLLAERPDEARRLLDPEWVRANAH